MTGGWFHTGDMAVWDDEGYIHIVDRKKEIIISGGENISSIEVEKAIAAHPTCTSVPWSARPTSSGGRCRSPSSCASPAQTSMRTRLVAFLGDRLGRFKMPRKFEFTEEPLPKTGTGKIRKMILREKFWEGMTRRVQG